MSFPSINQLLDIKPETSISPITINSFTTSDKSLKSSETPIIKHSPSEILLTESITPKLEERIDDKEIKKLHRRSYSDNTIYKTANSPLKSPSALEAVRLLAKTHNKEEPSDSPSSFKISNLFWSLEDSKTNNSSYKNSVLFNGWNQNDTPNVGKVFKVPLNDAVSNSSINIDIPLPAVVIRCIEYLDNEGLNEIGLYRIPGSTSLVNQLKNKFDTGEDYLLNEETLDPHAVATLFKLYLRELPENILTKKGLLKVNHFLASNKIPDTTETSTIPSHIDNRKINLANQIKALFNEIPDSNYYLLSWTFKHLARIVQNSSINKMNLSNLGLIFCPTLIISSKLFRILLEYNELIFPLPRPTGKTKKVSPRPYSISSIQTNKSTNTNCSINSLSSVLKFKASPLTNITQSKSSPAPTLKEDNSLLFENLAALSEMLQFTPTQTPLKKDRNSIISYQSSPRRRAQSIDSTISEDKKEADNLNNTESNGILNEDKDKKYSSSGILHLDYFDGNNITQALLNMKTRRNPNSINRNQVIMSSPNLKNNHESIAKSQIRNSNAFKLVDQVELDKKINNLKKIDGQLP